MILIKQVMTPLIGIQKNAQEVVKLLKIVNRVVDHMQEWTAKYPDAPQQLEKKDEFFIEIDRVPLRLHLQKCLYLGAQLINTMAMYK